jgi:hypothetical protein
MRRGSRIASEIGRRRFERAVELAEGRLPAIAARGADRSAALFVSDFRALPAQPGGAALQDANGHFYFLPDYSALDGPDILA